jgi:hypothetical protein
MTHPADALAFRLEKPVILPEALLEAARRAELEFADVFGFGALDWIELDRNGSIVRLDGPFDLLDLKGRIRRVGDMDLAEFVVTVSRHTDAGIQVLGGRLFHASGSYLELRLLPLTALAVAQAPAIAAAAHPPVAAPQIAVAAAAHAQFPAAEPLPPRPAPAPVVVEIKPNIGSKALSEKWAEALAESKKFEKTGVQAKVWDEDETTVAVVPQRGDVVNHRQFGRCLVAKIDDDHISLKKPDGRIVHLGLPILDFSVVGAEGAVTVFEVQVRRV